MAQKYVLTKQLKAVPLDQPIESGASVVEVITTQEFAKLGVAGADTLSALRTLTEAESTYLDVFSDSLIGSFAVPDKKDLMGETIKFAFYLNKANLTNGEARLFHSLEKTVERLLKRSQTLKEYSLQLRELYQTQIDIQQNDTMQWFTVITTLFAPLTLITSWFGMNFANMPGLDWQWGYQAIIVVCIVIIVVELVIFKRKKWL